MFNNDDSNLTTTSIKGALLMALIFAGLMIWCATAKAEYMEHWANVRTAGGDLIGRVNAGDYVEVLGQAEDVYRSYVYAPSLGSYGYICTVYIYGGTEAQYQNPYDYNGYSGYQEYSYEEESYSYPEEDYVYHYDEDYSPYDSYYEDYGYGYQDTWVEVDISDQTARLWDGRNVIAEDYCVTGNAEKSPTPTGYYNIYDKTRNTILRGYNYDGSTYASPVDYWMPFNGGIGLHDAQWRDSFGGDIYQYAGSHGCVNLPYYLARAIWDETQIGSPVVVHK